MRRVYRKRDDLNQMKRRARLTNIDLAGVLKLAPSTIGGKLSGYIALTTFEEKKIRDAIDKAMQTEAGAAA